MKNVVDYSGLRFGKLTVLYQIIKGPPTYRLIGFCLCDCGVRKFCRISHIKAGKITSCGCLAKERIGNLNRRHSHSGTLQHHSWKGMKQRCYNPNTKSYKDYGGRGIKICDRWLNSYDAFISDMGLPPSPLHSVERKDNDGDYEPSNCKWATKSEQALNRRKRAPYQWKENRAQ